MKAIKITEANQSMLMQRYDLIEEVFMPIGYWLVTDFGDLNMDFSLLDNTKFDELFERGRALQNGFIEIARKVV